MKRYLAYVRVSTARQGDGVSLTEQRVAIERYADQHGLPVVQWFEEIQTAAKRGRPVFRSLLTQIANGRADGLIIALKHGQLRGLPTRCQLSDRTGEIKLAGHQ